MSLVNRFPAGLLGLFDTKSLGRTPPNINDEVRPVVDMGPHYRATVGVTAAQEIENVAAGIQAVSVAEIPIPAGETWQVLGVSAGITHGGAENMWLAPCIVNVTQSETAGDASGSPVTMTLDNPTWGFNYTSTAATTQRVSFMFAQPVIFQAPVQFGCWIHRTGIAVARNFVTQVLYNRLD